MHDGYKQKRRVCRERKREKKVWGSEVGVGGYIGLGEPRRAEVGENQLFRREVRGSINLLAGLSPFSILLSANSVVDRRVQGLAPG